MRFKSLALSLVTLSALSACGSGGGGGDFPPLVAAPPGTVDGTPTTVPQPALSSPESLFAYAMSLITNETNDTSIPVALDGPPFPVDDTAAPQPIT